VIAGAAHAKELHNYIFYCYIHVLLVKTNTMIYNMLYKLCVLAVGDDELGIGILRNLPVAASESYQDPLVARQG